MNEPLITAIILGHGTAPDVLAARMVLACLFAAPIVVLITASIMCLASRKPRHKAYMRRFG